MASSSVELQFAAEFAVFLVAAAGLAVIVLRSELLSRSLPGAAALGAGFCGVGATALLRGSLLVRRGSDPALIAFMAIGLVLLLAGSLWWSAGRAARCLLWLALALLAAALWLEAVRPGHLGSAVLLGTGALALGAGLVRASRRAIAARVVSSAAAALLLLVLILSVALSQVLSTTVRNDAVRRLDGRAVSEATNVTATTRALLVSARQTRALLEAYCGGERQAPSCIRAYIPELSGDFFPVSPDLGQLFVDQSGYLVGRSSTLNPGASLGVAIASALAGSQVVRSAISGRTEMGTVVVAAGRPLAVATEPTMINEVRGACVVVEDLSNSYLDGRRQDDRSLSLALASADAVLSHAGPSLHYQSVRPPVRSVLDGAARQASGTAEARFVAVQPVSPTAGSPPALALVASTPTAVVDGTLASLFRTLFLIALGATVLALLFTAFVGDRIGAGLRRLTLAVDAVQRGDPDVRVEVISDDEVGDLGGAFDFMAASIEDKASALRLAARDEARLRDRLEAIVAGMGEALVAVDADGLITDYNAAAERLAGTKATAAVGRAVDQVINLQTEGGETGTGRLGEALGRRWEARGWLARPGDDAIPVSVSAGPLRDVDSQSAGGVYVLRDLRREQEAERVKAEFLSRIGHELRTPLTGIMGFTELLARRGAPDEQAVAWQAETLVQSKRLLRIVEMLEFFASSSASHFNLDLQPLDLRALINDLIMRWNERLSNGHIVVQRLSRQLPVMIADRRWLTLALDELTDNAVKFSPGGGTVTMRATLAAGMVEISVSDSGKGMSPEESDRVLAEFAQGDGSDTRQYGGLGLGLSMVQRVAVGHGGRLLFRSKQGNGSTFSILLPCPGDLAGNCSDDADTGKAGRKRDGRLSRSTRSPGRGAS